MAKVSCGLFYFLRATPRSKETKKVSEMFSRIAKKMLKPNFKVSTSCYFISFKGSCTNTTNAYVIENKDI